MNKNGIKGPTGPFSFGKICFLGERYGTLRGAKRKSEENKA
ncbi:hypothetical protein [Ligilactobacillus equi]|nr:hypothetical protein [Ligilactobacillus equi]